MRPNAGFTFSLLVTEPIRKVNATESEFEKNNSETMPITQLTPMSEIERYTDEQIERLKTALLRTLMYIGETCLNKARSTDSYKDQTGNLRSSLGYIITANGRVIKSSDFAVVKSGSQGAKDGLAYAKKVAREFPQSMCLIVVAGMNYAAYVSAKGLDVLDSSELLADSLTEKLLKQLGLN